MAYTIRKVYDFGVGNTGVSLRAQFEDDNGTNIGSAISTGFRELAGANGIFTHVVTIDDGQTGFCKIYNNAAPSEILTAFAITPHETESVWDLLLTDANVPNSFGTFLQTLVTSLAGTTRPNYSNRPLPKVPAGSVRPGMIITWINGDQTAVDLTGATITGKLYSQTSGLTRNIAGTFQILAPTQGMFIWNFHADDVVRGEYRAQFTATFSTAPLVQKSFITNWSVDESLS